MSITDTTVGIIGAGAIGGNVARLAARAGYSVIVSNSRGPKTLLGLVDELGPNARAATAEDAAEAADLVVAAVQFKYHAKLPATALRGKVLIDTMNYFPELDGVYPELDAREITSSELVQSTIPSARVVKALGNQFAKHIVPAARPVGDPARSALPLSGPADAKAVVAEFLTAIGYDFVDNGELADSWRHEAGQPVNVLPFVVEPPIDLTLDGLYDWMGSAAPRTVSAAEVRSLLDEADRGRRVGGATADWADILRRS